MKIKGFVAVATLIAACSFTLNAQEQGYWRAASTNAKSITGDITISETRITINFAPFTIASIRALKTAEVAAVFDADVNSGVQGTLYRLSIPSERRFLHKNTLCGTSDTEWMATFVTGRNLKVAFFSGENVPVLTIDALSNSMDVCGSFTYTR